MKTWHSIDKSEWADGPWKTEPDKAQWIDEQTGFDCLIVRGPQGALCGYVGVPKEHKFYGADYSAVDADCHGGLTFSDTCHPSSDESRGICHTGEVASENVWWLGFDCAHAWDVAPKWEREFPAINSVYREFNYVKDEVTQLAQQLKAA